LTWRSAHSKLVGGLVAVDLSNGEIAAAIGELAIGMVVCWLAARERERECALEEWEWAQFD